MVSKTRTQSRRPRKAPVSLNTVNERFLKANGVKPKTPLFARLKRYSGTIIIKWLR